MKNNVRNFSQETRERFLIGMMKVNFLKRLESSVKSFAITPTPAVVAPAPAAPVVEVAPVAPAADAKGVEKGKDLDRKMNQLFK